MRYTGATDAMATKSKTPKHTSPAPESESDRITYRELRNTPGRVWERLASDQPLTLVADGQAKAVVIPVHDGDTQSALDAYRRGRAMIALARIRRQAREGGASKMSLAQINAMIKQVRAERRREQRTK
jgi:hypothetical protein